LKLLSEGSAATSAWHHWKDLSSLIPLNSKACEQYEFHCNLPPDAVGPALAKLKDYYESGAFGAGAVAIHIFDPLDCLPTNPARLNLPLEPRFSEKYFWRIHAPLNIMMSIFLWNIQHVRPTHRTHEEIIIGQEIYNKLQTLSPEQEFTIHSTPSSTSLNMVESTMNALSLSPIGRNKRTRKVCQFLFLKCKF
jgi:hypothetical protein